MPAPYSGGFCCAPPAGLPVSREEQRMQKVIRWLLKLPEKERALAEQARYYPYGMESPAPRLQPARPPGAAEGHRRSQRFAADLGSVEAAALLANAGLRPALLNFASGYNCGGGFEHAAGSQEEDIFRKTSVFLSLWPHRREGDGAGVLKRSMWIGEFDEELPRKEPYYEISECGGIYSPHVRVAEDLPGDHGSLPVISVLTAAAQDVRREWPFNPDLLRQKLRTSLYMAAQHEHDTLVLGAFGCGCFLNPAPEVASTFQELLAPGGEFEGRFSLVVFAVPSFGSNYRGSNHDVFVRQFGVKNLREVQQLAARLAHKAPPAPAPAPAPTAGAVQPKTMRLSQFEDWIARTRAGPEGGDLVVLHVKGSSDCGDFEWCRESTRMSGMLESATLLVWDGDLHSDASFTALVPDFLRSGENKRAVAFQYRDGKDRFWESWQEPLRPFYDRTALVIVDLNRDTGKLPASLQNHVGNLSKHQAEFVKLGCVALRSTGGSRVVALGGGLVPEAELKVALEDGVGPAEWTVFDVRSKKSPEARGPLAELAAGAAAAGRGVELIAAPSAHCGCW